MTIDLIINNNQLQLCNNLHERDHVSFIQSIISVILLSLICLLGIIGNSLVIIVYCIKPKHYTNRYMMNQHTIINSNHSNNNNNSNNNNPLDTKMTKKFGTHSISLKSYKLPLYKNKLNQHNLILLLAFIDLFTCVFILPWDIYRVANYAYDETIPILSINDNNNNNLNQNSSSGNRIDINSNKGFYINYQLNIILTLLRNIIFACEGSVLTAIAFERYMILVKQDLCKSSLCCHHLLNNNNNNNNNNVTSLFHKTPSIHHTNHSNELTRSSTTLMNITNQKDKNHLLCSLNRCITSILILVIIGTCLFECILIILELMKWNCQFTEQLRELINQIYILLTFISFIIITYLYVRIFRIVRENDLRKQRWLTTIHNNTNYTSMKLLNKSNSFLQSSIYNNNEIEPILKVTNEHDTKIHHCDTTQSRRYGLSFRLMKQLSCDQVITKQPQLQQQEPPPAQQQQQEQCYHQHQLETSIQWNILKRRILLKTPSISTLFEHSKAKQESNKSIISKHNNQSIGTTTTTTTTTTTISSSISPLSVNRLLSKRVTRSHRTGLMIFISTVIFYATLFPVLWVHFKFWWKYTIIATPTTTIPTAAMTTTTNTTITNYSTNQLHNRTKFILNNQENDGSFMTTVHHEFYYVNNAVNFFIYSLFNQSFRERLKRLLAKY
ncbi:Ankyrin repeat domain-containing protein 42 [Schistosoma haematobium]|uniref:Ankyrin repeat domain-containing protein 42 n=2 Tax=Schistosoma haematobium TaxID=6185 RepID=A0A6A5DSA6_SCHHA|nr:Ankyrin repeat domain-containing protein 42 [Schistosoma haematobium]KAH9592863.1 Ankyrin repeat domain-containing protein 42 [Schistosoma haematobium]